MKAKLIETFQASRWRRLIVNHGKGNGMGTEEVAVFALKADQQTLELVHPGKRALRYEAPLGVFFVEQAGTPCLGTLAVTLVLL